MQDRYVGDVGDYGKYGLLRALIGEHPSEGPRLQLGIVWYAFRPDDLRAEATKDDGRHISYLEDGNHRYSECDSALYGALKGLVSAGQRKILAIQQSRILPPSTAYFSELLTYRGLVPDARETYRQGWLAKAFAQTSLCELVFFDPDNGLASERREERHADAPKYAFIHEVCQYAERGQSFVLYHHLGRHMSHEKQIDVELRRLRGHLPPSHALRAVRFHRGTSRAYFMAYAKERMGILSVRIDKLLQGPWKAHFEEIVGR